MKCGLVRMLDMTGCGKIGKLIDCFFFGVQRDERIDLHCQLHRAVARQGLCGLRMDAGAGEVGNECVP